MRSGLDGRRFEGLNWSAVERWERRDAELFDIGDEAIAASRDRLDETGRLSVVAEDLAELADVVRDVSFLDEALSTIRPWFWTSTSSMSSIFGVRDRFSPLRLRTCSSELSSKSSNLYKCPFSNVLTPL